MGTPVTIKESPAEKADKACQAVFEKHVKPSVETWRKAGEASKMAFLAMLDTTAEAVLFNMVDHEPVIEGQEQRLILKQDFRAFFERQGLPVAPQTRFPFNSPFAFALYADRIDFKIPEDTLTDAQKKQRRTALQECSRYAYVASLAYRQKKKPSEIIEEAGSVRDVYSYFDDLGEVANKSKELDDSEAAAEKAAKADKEKAEKARKREEDRKNNEAQKAKEAEAKKKADEAKAAEKAADKERKEQERKTHDAEAARVRAEKARAEAEKKQAEAEAETKKAEEAKKQAEEKKRIAEKEMAEREEQRKVAEAEAAKAREEADAARKLAEANRKKDEENEFVSFKLSDTTKRNKALKELQDIGVTKITLDMELVGEDWMVTLISPHAEVVAMPKTTKQQATTH